MDDFTSVLVLTAPFPFCLHFPLYFIRSSLSPDFLHYLSSYSHQLIFYLHDRQSSFYHHFRLINVRMANTFQFETRFLKRMMWFYWLHTSLHFCTFFFTYRILRLFLSVSNSYTRNISGSFFYTRYLARQRPFPSLSNLFIVVSALPFPWCRHSLSGIPLEILSMLMPVILLSAPSTHWYRSPWHRPHSAFSN